MVSKRALFLLGLNCLFALIATLLYRRLLDGQEKTTPSQQKITIPNHVKHLNYSKPDAVFQARLCQQQWSSDRVSNAVITFITPSKGRYSLMQTLQSLLSQSSDKWLSIIVLDGVLSNSLYLNKSTNLPHFMNAIPQTILEDGRFCFQHLPVSDRASNCASDIRNFGVKMVLTDWIGFVDDDDILKPNYVKLIIRQSSMYPNADVIIFRMCQYFPETGKIRIIPNLIIDKPVLNDLGISFSTKRRIFHDLNYKFIPSNIEDFLFVDRLYQDNIGILQSEHITYLVKGFRSKHCKRLGNRKFLQRGSHLPPQYTEKTICTVRGDYVQPKFTFTEANSDFFGRNVKGLRQSLKSALQKRCFAEHMHSIDHDIHVMFQPDEKPVSPYYIQVQLEQRGSFHFNQAYRDKLSNAMQIWEFSYSTVHGLQKLPGIETDVYFMPTMLTLDNSAFIYNCPSISPEKSSHHYDKEKVIKSTPFMVYRFGRYYTCKYNQKKRSWVLAKSVFSSCNGKNNTGDYCWGRMRQKIEKNIPDDPGSICTNIMRRKSPIDVLMFGRLDESFGNQREHLCDILSLNGHSVYCVQNVFGELLNYLVCISKIVVVNHYFQQSSLETHRIDPLLQAKKLVVASLSGPSVLDTYYADVIPLVHSNRIPSKVQEILQVYDGWMRKNRYIENVSIFLKTMTKTLDPLCFALSQLAAKLMFNQTYHRWF